MLTRARRLERAQKCAEPFIAVLPQIAAAVPDLLPPTDCARTLLALRQLDGLRLWDLYLEQRHMRGQLPAVYWEELRQRHGVIPPALCRDLPPGLRRRYELHAFLARAYLAPASALQGRARSFLEQYVAEGMEHAAWLLAPSAPASAPTATPIALLRPAIPALDPLSGT